MLSVHAIYYIMPSYDQVEYTRSSGDGRRAAFSSKQIRWYMHYNTILYAYVYIYIYIYICIGICA